MKCIICGQEIKKGDPAIKIEIVLEPKFQYACLSHFLDLTNEEKAIENVTVFSKEMIK